MIDIIQTDNHEDLHGFLVKHNFTNLKDHTEIVYYATIFKFIHNQSTAGFVWMYELENEPGRFNVHMHIADKYKGKILNRYIVNKFYQMTKDFAEVLEADPINQTLINLYQRIGWQQNTDHSVELKLPYIWRNNYGSRKEIS